MTVISSRYHAYVIDVVHPGFAWRWNAFATRMDLAVQVLSDGKRYESSDLAFVAARTALDEVLGRLI